MITAGEEFRPFRMGFYGDRMLRSRCWELGGWGFTDAEDLNMFVDPTETYSCNCTWDVVCHCAKIFSSSVT